MIRSCERQNATAVGRGREAMLPTCIVGNVIITMLRSNTAYAKSIVNTVGKISTPARF